MVAIGSFPDNLVDELEKSLSRKVILKDDEALKLGLELFFKQASIVSNYQAIFNCRFIEGETLEAVGNKFGITRERVRAICNKVIKYLSKTYYLSLIEEKVESDEGGIGEEEDILIKDCGFSRRVENSLGDDGIVYLSELKNMPHSVLLTLVGIGERGALEIEEKINRVFNDRKILGLGDTLESIQADLFKLGYIYVEKDTKVSNVTYYKNPTLKTILAIEYNENVGFNFIKYSFFSDVVCAFIDEKELDIILRLKKYFKKRV